MRYTKTKELKEEIVSQTAEERTTRGYFGLYFVSFFSSRHSVLSDYRTVLQNNGAFIRRLSVISWVFAAIWAPSLRRENENKKKNQLPNKKKMEFGILL